MSAIGVEARPSPPTEPVDRLGPRQLAAVGLIVWLLAALALGARATNGARVTADEPQYLLTALSLAQDLDLDIGDEIRSEQFRPFHEIALDPQTIDLDGRGQRLSPHDPLLPLVLAPAMGLGGWVGAKLALAALAGLTAAVTAWVSNRRLGVGARATLIAVVGLFATPPLTSYGTQIYPEIPAALAVAVGLAALLGPDDPLGPGQARRRWLVVISVVALPWLSVKYVPVAAVLALALLGRGRRPSHRPAALSVTAALLAAGVLYLIAHQRVYGGWTVYAAGDHFVGGELDVVGVDPDYPGRSRRLIGLLIDRRFGLVPWSPLYLLLVPALAAMARRSDWPRAVLAGVLGTGWAMATWVALTMHGWWWPGRQVVVVLPVVALAIAGLLDRRPRLLPVAVVAAAIAVVNWLWLVLEASTGRRTLVVDFFDTGAWPYRLLAPLFPDHVALTPTDWVLTGLWTAAVAASALTGWWMADEPAGERRANDRPEPGDRPSPPSQRSLEVGAGG